MGMGREGGPWTAVVAFVVLGSGAATATPIQYELTALGGSAYRYTYTVTHDGSVTGPLSAFDIDFDAALYDEASLQIVSDAGVQADWDETILGSGVGVPALYDVVTSGAGLGPGESATGFAVEFQWLGAGLPGTQGFSLFDPQTFAILATGQTAIIGGGGGTVPEPGTIGLLLVTLALISRARSRASRS